MFFLQLLGIIKKKNFFYFAVLRFPEKAPCSGTHSSPGRPPASPMGAGNLPAYMVSSVAPSIMACVRRA